MEDTLDKEKQINNHSIWLKLRVRIQILVSWNSTLLILKLSLLFLDLYLLNVMCHLLAFLAFCHHVQQHFVGPLLSQQRLTSRTYYTELPRKPSQV